MLLTSVSPAAAYAPLRHSAFRMLWIATLASNTGLWIQNTGAGWLMTSLAPSPVMVSLVQAASMLPVFLFALPGGVLADILDRRLTLIAAQIWVVVAGLLLAGLAVMGWLGAWGLLAEAQSCLGRLLAALKLHKKQSRAVQAEIGRASCRERV